MGRPRLAAALALLLSSSALATRPYRARPADPQPDDGLATLGATLAYQFATVSRVDVGGGRTRVSVESGQVTPRGGYFPMRVFIDNTLGPKQTVALTLRGNVSRGVHSVSRAVEVEAGERRVVSVPVLAEMRYGTVEARGPGITERGAGSVYFTATHKPQRALLSLGQPEQFEQFVGHAPSYSGSDVYVSTIPALEAPTELAAYVGYDGVILPQAGLFEELSEAQRRALEAYAAAGGTLTVRGPLRAAGQFPLLDPTVDQISRAYGFGTLVISRPEGAVEGAWLSQTLLTVSPQGEPPEWERRYGGSHWDLLLPQATAPLGRFLLIIGLFSLAIGPGSLWIARKRGPAALLVTIPGTALVTCASIIGYSLVADGFTVHGAVYGYTLLDRKSNRAITSGVTAYYANLAPGRASFPATTAVVAAYAEGRDHPIADVEWADGARFGADFLPSRVYREWGFVSVEPTRARLVLRKTPDGHGWVVQNALGGALAAVVVQIDGAAWTAGELRDGGEKALVRASAPFTGAGRADGRFSRTVRDRVLDERLDDGEFIARLEGQGFVPTGGVRLALHESDQFVRGEVEQ